MTDRAEPSKTIVGSIEVVLYAGLRGADPIEVGTLRAPLTLKTASTGTIEASLTEALQYVAEDFKAVFASEDDPTTTEETR
jgi:hypothetical protein